MNGLTAGQLVGAIESRLADLSDQRHRAAAEVAKLTEQLTALRIGVITPEAALLALQTAGVRLRVSRTGGLTIRERVVRATDPAWTPVETVKDWPP